MSEYRKSKQEETSKTEEQTDINKDQPIQKEKED